MPIGVAIKCSTLQKGFDTAYAKCHQKVILRRADTPIMEIPKPTYEHGWLMDYDGNMVSLWFD